MRVFILNSITQSGYYYEQPVGRVTKRVRHGAQQKSLTRCDQHRKSQRSTSKTKFW